MSLRRSLPVPRERTYEISADGVRILRRKGRYACVDGKNEVQPSTITVMCSILRSRWCARAEIESRMKIVIVMMCVMA